MVAAIILALATIGMNGTDLINCGERSTTAGVDRRPTHIVLQIVSTTRASHSMLATMIEEAAAIWEPYSVIVSPFFEMVRPDDREGRWITLILRDEPANRIDGKAPRRHRARASLVFTDDTPGDAMYVSLEMARRMIHDAGLGKGSAAVEERLAARLLGRATAHELGHFLLGSKDHARHGLMRSTFRAQDSSSGQLERFRLLPDQT